ncbi:MAG: NB-ARC domain-containing protein, partial [Actinomycetota bacterium]|nr:NB-ARC domain-containing protein [Actinomycetota bacterium]
MVRRGDAGKRAAESVGPVWNVPERRKRVLVGREGLLADLQSRLQTGSTAVLIGRDGMGKTAVAAEYAYRHSADYDAVWWVRAERPEILAADYARLATVLGLSAESAQDQALQVDTARRWLEGHGRWLLVFDDAAGVDSWQPYLPAGARGHVLVTARTPVPGWEPSTLAVGELSHDDAVTFLLQRTGDDDVASALAIADALRDLPLALDHAAAYVQDQGTLADYLVGLRRHAKDLFLTGEPADDAYTVASTVGMSLEAARRSSRAAGELMRLCAHLAPDDIPHDLLLAHPDALK